MTGRQTGNQDTKIPGNQFTVYYLLLSPLTYTALLAFYPAKIAEKFDALPFFNI